MIRGIGDLLQTVAAVLPPWAVAATGAVLLLAAAPLWLESVRTKQIRGLVRRMVRAPEAQRLRLRDEVLALAGDRPHRLAHAAREAMRRDQADLRERALARLEATDRGHDELARLRKAVVPEGRTWGHPLEAAAVVERLLAAGARNGARERLAEALVRFPDDPDLRALATRLDRP